MTKKLLTRGLRQKDEPEKINSQYRVRKTGVSVTLDILHGLKLVLVPETEHEHEHAEAEFSRIHIRLVTSHDAGRALARSPLVNDPIDLNVPETVSNYLPPCSAS